MGTAISIGYVCYKRATGAEVWDAATGRSKIVDLGRWFPRPFSAGGILAGRGDEAWIMPRGWARIVRYRNGQFEAVPDLERPIQNAFVAPSGQLHASDGEVIHRLEQDGWKPVARLADLTGLSTLAMDASGALWAGSGPGARIYRLRERGVTNLPPAGACTTPFVFFYELPFRDANARFSATRKSVAGFSGASQLELVDIISYGVRNLGARVPNRTQADALIAHLRATVKDADPRFLCFDSRSGHKIDLAKGLPDLQHDGE